MTNVRKVISAVASVTFAAALGMAATPATAFADPAGHQVTYTVTATGNLTGNVRYMNTDPPSQAAYDANSSQFMSSVPATFAAGQPLVYTTTLADPNQWAIVTASGGCHWPDCDSSNVPQIQCQIAVDGQVVVTQSATTGVTCSTRRW
ncbi:hypothetical protein BN971_03589 [Mycobacterium bohemicum DSM 44277]|uniref:Uncharacterized protein n=2 Tax=Mycobacterium bohemicum TaxID=56425 RepID=A0A1X1R9F4_MYCBE|nr:hypothetical protein [Mycobacterium bohemicum]MCV6972649.1 hypothetical protein [Mycobacterium bohemicum]ORV01806.1 hypothetical protein AWB93_06285 [Mycobacterium bohemicum]CPR12295.1 hypothetical protein BN971_03589 [Mycobacterium bohemicum DSM 44277]